MGLMRALFLGDLGLCMDIADVERDITWLRGEIAQSFRKDMSQDEKLAKLVNENATLTLYFVSLARLLTKKGLVSREELAAMVAAVDAEDGRDDGRFTGKAVFSEKAHDK